MTATVTVTPNVSPQLETSDIALKKVLVAIDFSRQTPRTMEAAIAVARSFRSELILVHGATPLVYGTGAEPIPIETFDVALDIAKARMSDLVTDCADLKAIKHREIVTYCSPDDLIDRIVKDEKVDLVIAGSHGASGLERLAIGSIAQAILQHVSCPTLIVGPHSDPVQHPFRSILFATDLEDTGLRAAQYASGLAEHFHGKLMLLHVIEPKAMRTGHLPEFSEEETIRDLRRLLPPDLAIYTSGEVRVEYGKASETIMHVAQSVCPSLIVTGVCERSILADHAPWSTLAHVIRQAHCPVLVVRRTLH